MWKTGLDKIISYAEDNDIDIIQALNADLKFLVKHRGAVERYLSIINTIEEIESIHEKIKYIIDTLNYKEYLKGLGEEADVIDRKMENLDELISDAVRFEESSGFSLTDYLASAALVTSGDEDAEHSVKLMTMHAAKGLEFKIVFLTGLEEGLFPLGNNEGETDIEEERRLCYVGITRAMETLYITRARNRLSDTDNKDFGGFGFNDDSITHFTCSDPLYAKDKKEWLKLYLPARTALVLKRVKNNYGVE